MTTLSTTALRARRIVRLFNEIQAQSGSTSLALRHTAHVVTAKLPLAFRQMRMLGRFRSVARDIGDIREAALDPVPLIGIKVSGGLGDFLVVARFLRDLSAYAGGFNFDIYSTDPDRARWIFGTVPGLRACHDDLLFEFTLQEYDLAARISQFVILHDNVARWRRLRVQPNLVRAASNTIRFRPKIETFIERHPYYDGFLAQKAVYANCRRADFLHHMAGVPYGGDRLDVTIDEAAPQQFGLEPRRYITIHNGFDPQFTIYNDQATKCYPHFDQVIALLKQALPDITFVQLGVATSKRMVQADVDLLNRTSMSQTSGIIAGALLHIDNEGGLVHLARCLGVTSCVVFGPTPSNYFGYEGNINIDPVFCGGCWWINETWMNHCPRGFATARCMTDQKPAEVASAITTHLAKAATTPNV